MLVGVDELSLLSFDVLLFGSSTEKPVLKGIGLASGSLDVHVVVAPLEVF